MRSHGSLNRIWKAYKWHYAFILPGIVLLFLFAYIPMFGVVAAFQEYRVYLGFANSPWVGWKHFAFLIDPYFWESVKNTVLITIYRLIFGYPAPIILALMLNEVRHEWFKRTVQSTSYLPHFMSWIVVAYMLTSAMALDTGIVNSVLQWLGRPQINFMSEPEYFRFLIVSSGIWKEIGWGTIIYLAALSNISKDQVEAALLDGAGRFARIWYVNVPAIMPIIGILFILSMPGLLSAGYEQIYPLVNPANLEVSNVLDVYVIRLGLGEGQYSKATAIGFMLSAVQIALVIFVNHVLKWLGQDGLW